MLEEDFSFSMFLIGNEFSLILLKKFNYCTNYLQVFTYNLTIENYYVDWLAHLKEFGILLI